jgi:hypothetical protein
MTLVCGCVAGSTVHAATPEPLDVEFLDYLATCEGKDDNWTVVAKEKDGKKPAEPAKPPASTEPPKQQEIKR